MTGAGLDKYSASLIKLIGSYIAPGVDVGISQVLVFGLFWLVGLTNSLFGREMSVDGCGIHFNTEVFCWPTTNLLTASCEPSSHRNEQKSKYGTLFRTKMLTVTNNIRHRWRNFTACFTKLHFYFGVPVRIVATFSIRANVNVRENFKEKV